MTDRQREHVVATLRALLAEWSDGPPANWENTSLPRYLEALAAWLQDCDGYYANQGLPFPEGGWEVMRDALQAAKSYE
ncbi:MAG TPA: hypothetical protein VGL47_08990 [Amycolatopsis sp.]|uniref:DUF7660 family protein n=1 Tax=Amycolatopsis sp. TaxID=37632 RepID=UPI002F406148